MKISIDGREVLVLSDLQMKVLNNEISINLLEKECERLVAWVLTQKYEDCFKRLCDFWKPKLLEFGIINLPHDADKLATLIFQHPEYRNSDQRVHETNILEEINNCASFKEI